MSCLIRINTVCQSVLDLWLSHFWQQWMCPESKMEESVLKTRLESDEINFTYPNSTFTCRCEWATGILNPWKWGENDTHKIYFGAKKTKKITPTFIILPGLVSYLTHFRLNIFSHSLYRKNFNFRYVGLCDLDISSEKLAKLFANSGDPDQTSYSVVSDLGMPCLSVAILGVSRLIWVW